MVAQFVPIKLDINSAEYRQWRRDHPVEGNGVPKLFVVRADGETLYGKSGSLTGAELSIMLAGVLRSSGKILSPKEASALVDAAESFAKLKESGEIGNAVKALSRVRKIGEPGSIESYSAPAVALNTLVIETATEVKTQLDQLAEKLEIKDASEKLDAILEFLEIRRNYGALRILKPELAAFQKKHTTKENSQLTREARVIDSARIANSKNKKARAIGKLRELIAESEIDAVKSIAKSTIETLEVDESVE